jgi:hypothetical protein
MVPILNYFFAQLSIKIASFSNQWCCNVFLSLQCNMIETMKVYGGNNYKVLLLGSTNWSGKGNFLSHYVVIPFLLIKQNELYQRSKAK